MIADFRGPVHERVTLMLSCMHMLRAPAWCMQAFLLCLGLFPQQRQKLKRA